MRSALMPPAPIALFAFNRPDHLRRTLEALASNDLAAESDLTIFCDGPRHAEEKKLADEVRAVAVKAAGFKSVDVVCREENLGCAASVIRGVTEMFSAHESLIVIEDDILCSPYTLRFLNTALKKYESYKSVFNISAWSPPAKIFPIPAEYPYDVYCIPRFNCWGWASWRDRWEKIDWGVADYDAFAGSDCLQAAFNSGGADLAAMLADQMDRKIDTWDIRMDYARFKHGCVGLNPVRSYTTNIGMGLGTHTTQPTDRFDNDVSFALPDPHLPDHIFVDPAIARAYRRVYAPPSLSVRAVHKACRMLFRKNLLRTSGRKHL